jgi:hypothetical protein
MHPDMASALASQHRHEMTAKAGHHARTTLAAAQAGETAEACQAAHASQASHASRASQASQAARRARGARLQAAASPRGPRRGARRPHLPGALLPRYRVSWSRTALSTAAADGARRGRSWIIVISATRSL